MCLFHQGKLLNNSFIWFEGCCFGGIVFPFSEIHLIYQALKYAAEITVQFQEKLCRERARTACYSYCTKLDYKLLFLILRGESWAMRSDCWDILMLLRAQWCECFQYGSVHCLHLHLMPMPSTRHESTKVLSDADDSHSLNMSHAWTNPPSHRRHQMPLDEADVPSQPDHDHKVTFIYFGFIKSSKAPAPANETWARWFKKVFIEWSAAWATWSRKYCLWGSWILPEGRGAHGNQGDHSTGSGLSCQGAEPPHLRRRSPMTVTAINQLVIIRQGERVRPEVHPGRPFGNNGGQEWASNWSIVWGPSRKSHQEAKTGQDRAVPPTCLSHNWGSVLKWGSLSMGRKCMGGDSNTGLWVPLWLWQCPSPFKVQ